jgi:hypothetical protein
MTLPDKPVVEILGTSDTGCGNPEEFGIPNPLDKRLSKAIAQESTLATDLDSALEFPIPRNSPAELPAPAPVLSSSKPLTPLIGGISSVTIPGQA